MSVQSFVDQMAPYALTAQNETGINANVILAQWANETANGTSPAFVNDFNPAGIGITSASVSGQDYGSIAGGVQAYINFVNDNSRYQAVKAAGVNNPQAQAVALGNSGWAAGGYNNGGGPGSDLIAGMSSFTTPAGITPANLDNPPVGLENALGPTNAANPQVQTYFESLANSAVTTPGNAPSTTPTIANEAEVGATTASAEAQVATVLQQAGLGSLAPWANQQIAQLAGQGMDPSDIATQIGVDLYSTPQFNAAFPGMAIRQAKGLPAMSVADYLAYVDQANQYAQAAGLPTGFMNATTIGNLIGNDVSATELNQRLTAGYQAAMNAPQETRNLLSQYYGVNTGDLAAYYLDPTKAESLLQNQLVGAEVGTQAAQSGFGALTASNATALSQELAAQGKVGQTSGKWDVDVGSTFSTLAPLAKLENAMPGMGAAAPALTQQQLLNYGFLSKGQQNVQTAVETRKAFAGGGGGEDVTGAGVVGTGSASDAGIKQQTE